MVPNSACRIAVGKATELVGFVPQLPGKSLHEQASGKAAVANNIIVPPVGKDALSLDGSQYIHTTLGQPLPRTLLGWGGWKPNSHAAGPAAGSTMVVFFAGWGVCLQMKYVLFLCMQEVFVFCGPKVLPRV